MSGVERRIQRRLNMLSALTCMGRGALSITELSREINVSRPAAEQVVADLHRLGWVCEGSMKKYGGRPAVTWEIVPDALLVLSVDIGAHHVALALARYGGEIIETSSHPLGEDLLAAERIDEACSRARTLVQGAGYELSDLALVCVASPGAIDHGRVIYFGGHGMPDWQGVDLSAEVQARLLCPVIVAGDCALGALGESWRGGAQGHRDVLYVLAGMRTGAAAIIGGRVHAGQRGSAGLIGELSVLQWRAIEEEVFVRRSYPEGQPPTRQQIFEAAAGGDGVAQSVVDQYADALALGSAAMVLALGPSHVVVGGKFAAWAPLFIERFERRIREYCPLPPSVSSSLLEGSAVVLGGVKYALDDIAERLRRQVMDSEVFPEASLFRRGRE